MIVLKEKIPGIKRSSGITNRYYKVFTSYVLTYLELTSKYCSLRYSSITTWYAKWLTLLQICSQLSERLEKQQTGNREELTRLKVWHIKVIIYPLCYTMCKVLNFAGLLELLPNYFYLNFSGTNSGLRKVFETFRC